MPEELVLLRVREGAGKMPPFKQILNGKEQAVIDFLYNKKRDLSILNNEHLQEIQQNRTSMGQAKADSTARKDTGVLYLNTQAYYPLRDLKATGLR